MNKSFTRLINLTDISPGNYVTSVLTSLFQVKKLEHLLRNIHFIDSIQFESNSGPVANIASKHRKGESNGECKKVLGYGILDEKWIRSNVAFKKDFQIPSRRSIACDYTLRLLSAFSIGLFGAFFATVKKDFPIEIVLLITVSTNKPWEM